MTKWAVTALGAALALAATAAFAVPTEEEIARLGGPELTPIGAERAGNAEGTIPEWTGGVTEPPPGWEPGMKRPDLFGDDEILFTIDASNVDQHADKLTPGQVALVKSYEGYRMDVYPTRRSCAYPEADYENMKRNAGTASVDDQCFLTGGTWTVLFPFPENGCQAIQNGRVSAFGGLTGYDRREATLIPTKSGSFVPVRRRQVLYFRTHDPKFETFEDLEGVWTKSLSHTVAPPKQAGEITLVYSLNDGHLKAWTYNPGQRRVRRNPNFEYDNPIPGFQGLMTIDQTNGYVGAADRYNWKLLGKREIYVPYNNMKFHHRQARLLPGRGQLALRRGRRLRHQGGALAGVRAPPAAPLRVPQLCEQRQRILRPGGRPLRDHAGLQRGKGSRLRTPRNREPHHRRRQGALQAGRPPAHGKALRSGRASRLPVLDYPCWGGSRNSSSAPSSISRSISESGRPSRE